MKLFAGHLPGEEESRTHESPDWNQPPDYALRAIRAQSSRELGELIADGANRLSKSVASYCDSFHIRRDEQAEGQFSLHPMIFAEGSRVAENLVGQLDIFVDPHNSRGNVASLGLRGGQDAPYDLHAEVKAPSHLSRWLTIREHRVTDPVLQQRIPAYYTEVTARYDGDAFRGQDGLLFEAKYGKPIEAYGHVLVADLFWALDTAITYYENVYIAGNKHPGLTYTDYRDAGCLKDDLTLDWPKAEAFVRLHMDDETTERSGGWPVLRDWETTTLTLDEDARAEVEKHKGYLRPTIEFNQPHLLHVS